MDEDRSCLLPVDLEGPRGHEMTSAQDRLNPFAEPSGAAVELALEAGAPTKTHILNLLHRLVDGKPTDARLAS
jgi:hypothetical protein